MRLLIIDNYDSFTWNLVDLFEVSGRAAGVPVDIRVVRNDAASLAVLQALAPDGVVLSPGPNTPEEAGLCLELVRAWAGRLPIFGVCLGLQAIAVALGGRAVRAPAPVHGKRARIHHDGCGLYQDVPQRFEAMRYHSLVVDAASLPPGFEVSAWLAAPGRTATGKGIVMGLRNSALQLEGVQFHPESVGTPTGLTLGRAVLDWMAGLRGNDMDRVS